MEQEEERQKRKLLYFSQKEVSSAADSSALFFNALHGTDSKISIQGQCSGNTFATKRRTMSIQPC